MREQFEKKENMEMREWSCQCGIKTCGLKVEISAEELDKIIKKGEMVIVEGCENNWCDPADLLERRTGYSIYRLGKLKPGPDGYVGPLEGF